MNRMTRKIESALLLFTLLSLLLAFNALYVVVLTLLALAIHEGAHALVYLLLGYPPGRVRLSLGGLRLGTRGRLSDCDRLLVALGGPVANLIAFFFCYILSSYFGEYCIVFANLHLLLALSNLLPIKGRDGDVILYCSLMLAGREAVYHALSPALTLSVEILFTLLSLYAIRTLGEGYLPAAVFLFGMLATLYEGAKPRKTSI